jgi:hypothetical protein
MKATKFTNLFLLAMVFAACSAPAAPITEVESKADASSTTEAVVVPTETERSTAAPTLSPRLEVVESVTWIDQLGAHIVDILARNPFDYPVYVTLGQAIVHDSSGATLAASDFYVGDGSVMGGLGLILPGETIPASTCCWDEEILQGLGDNWADTLTIVLKVEKADPIAYSTDFDVEAGTFINEAYDSYALNGSVTYHGEEPLSRAFVRVLVYDRDGNYIGWGEAFIGVYNNNDELVNIEPGTNQPFSALVSFTISEGPLEYEITVIGVVAQD